MEKKGYIDKLKSFLFYKLENELIFISYSDEDRLYVDAIATEVHNEEGIDIYAAHIKPPPDSEDYQHYIIEKIKSSTGAILLVSKNSLKSDFINNQEYPLIFNRKSKDKNYHISIALVEDCNFEDNKYLKNKQFSLSPSTSLSKLKSQSSIFSLAIKDLLSRFIKNYAEKERRKAIRKLNFFIIPLFVLLSLPIFRDTMRIVIPFLGEVFTEASTPQTEPSTPQEISNNRTFPDLKEGDCFNYNEAFVAYVLAPGLADKNNKQTIQENAAVSLALENGYIGEDISIVDCSSPHSFEVTYTSNSKPIDGNLNPIENGFQLQELCIDKSFYYSGNKISNVNSFQNFQFREIDNTYMFICTSFEYGDDYQIISKKRTHKDFQLLSEDTLYEATFNELEVGDCFLHNNAWGVKEYNYSWKVDGYSEIVEVVSCESPHPYEVIAELELEVTDNGVVFPGVALPFEVREVISQEYPIIENFTIQGYEEYEGASLASIITSNQYFETIRSNSDFEMVQYELIMGEDIFLEVVKPGEEKYWHFIKIEGSNNISSKSLSVLLAKGDNYCSSLPIYGVPAYANYLSNETKWWHAAIINGDPSGKETLNVKCLARLESTDTLAVAGLTSDRKNTGSLSGLPTDSIVSGFLKAYEYKLSDTRNYWINSNVSTGNYLIKKITDLKKGDCYDTQGLYDYKKRLNDDWNDDWYVLIKSCNTKHSHEVILEFDVLMNNQNKQELVYTCDDYLYYNLQFSKKATKGNFTYSKEDYDNESFTYSSEGLSLKDTYRNRYFIKNLVDDNLQTLSSICLYWQEPDEASPETPVHYDYISAFEEFTPAELNIANYYCPEIVDSNDEVEVVFEFTRGLSEIVSLTYIEISGEKAREDNGFVIEGVPEGELQKFMNSVYSGLSPSIIEFLDDSEKGTLTATITDEAGNSDSAICSYTIKNK